MKAIWHHCPAPKVDNSGQWSWSAFNGCFCICLQERPDRFQSSVLEFQRVGLAKNMQFYRPMKPSEEEVRALGFERVAAFGSWESHRAVAQKALELNAFKTTPYGDQLGCIFVCEDDVQFVNSFCPERLWKMQKQIASLNIDWEIFYFGWFSVPLPWNSWPASITDLSLWRTSAVTLHCYALSEKGARRLAGAPYHAYVSQLLPPFFGSRPKKQEHFLDDFTRQGFVGYGSLPMVAVQSDSVSDQPVRGKELGLALHNRVVRHFPMFLETVTMIIPFICLVVVLFGLLQIVSKWMNEMKEIK